jgi:hypothetical protein
MSTLPTSGITEHQSTIVYPRGVYETFPTDPADGSSAAVPQPWNGLNSNQEMMILNINALRDLLILPLVLPSMLPASI